MAVAVGRVRAGPVVVGTASRLTRVPVVLTRRTVRLLWPTGRSVVAAVLDRVVPLLVEQVRELERQGLQELMFATGVPEKWGVAEAFARRVMARV